MRALRGLDLQIRVWYFVDWTQYAWAPSASYEMRCDCKIWPGGLDVRNR